MYSEFQMLMICFDVNWFIKSKKNVKKRPKKKLEIQKSWKKLKNLKKNTKDSKTQKEHKRLIKLQKNTQDSKKTKKKLKRPQNSSI